MNQEQVREIAWIAWKGAANAFRMYPDNKHTFTDYWYAAKDQFSAYSPGEQGGTRLQTRVCPICQGEGFTTNGVHHGHKDYEEYDCESCDTTGKITLTELEDESSPSPAALDKDKEILKLQGIIENNGKETERLSAYIQELKYGLVEREYSYDETGGNKIWEEMTEVEQLKYELNKKLSAIEVQRNTIKRLRSNTGLAERGEEIKQAKIKLIWDMIEDYQCARDVDEDIEDPKFSYNDIEVELYDWLEKIDPNKAHTKPTASASSAEQGEDGLTFGELLTMAIRNSGFEIEELAVSVELGVSVLCDLMADNVYLNNIPIRLIQKIIRKTNIPFEIIEKSAFKSFYLIKKFEADNNIEKHPWTPLWENEEALTKYLTRLKELAGGESKGTEGKEPAFIKQVEDILGDQSTTEDFKTNALRKLISG